METLIEKDIYDIRNKYKFEYSIDTPFEDDKANEINEKLFLTLLVIIDEFDIKKKTKLLTDKIEQKRPYLNSDKIKYYENNINVVKEKYKKLKDESIKSFNDYISLIDDYNESYSNNHEKPGVLNIYNNIIIELLNVISETCIKLESKLISINNLINEINSSLK